MMQTTFNENISNWDVSNVTNMAQMFYVASSFNQDISNWDVSNVTNMENMFNTASSFNQDISNWDVSSLEKMSAMFYYNSAAFVINDESVSFPPTSFNQDISNWNVSNVTNFSYYGGSNPSGLSSHSSDLFKNSDPLYFTSDTEIVETVHTFIHNGSGNNYTTHSITFNEPTECDVLIVGGGGAGGSDTGGGGGGGQVLYYTNDNVSFKTGNSIILNGTYDINVVNHMGKSWCRWI